AASEPNKSAGVSRRNQKIACQLQRSLGGAARRFRLEELTKGFVDGCGRWKLGSDVGLQQHEIGALGKALRVLATGALREIVLRSHVVGPRRSLGRSSRLLHRWSVPDGWRVER